MADPERRREWTITPPAGGGGSGRWEITGPGATRSPMQPWQAALSGFADAATFGWGDELAGVFFGGEATTEASRRRQEMARAYQPGAFFAGEIGGMLAGGGAIGTGLRAGVGATRLANAARQVGPLGRIGIGAGVGGAGGALYGAGQAPSDDMRFQNAMNYVLPGAVGGGAFSALGEVAGPVFRNVRMSMSPEARSGRMLAESMERFGPPAASPQQLNDDVINALRDAPDNAMVGDVLPGMTQMVRGAAVRPSRMRDSLREAWDADNVAMGARASDDLWQTLGGGQRRDVADVVGSLRDVQRTQAAPLYAQAYQQRIDPARAQALTGEIVRRNPAIFEPAQGHARALMLSELGQEIADPADPRYWHYLLQGAQRELGARLRAANLGDMRGFHGPEIAAYTRAVTGFNAQVRRLLGPEFRSAQDIYSGASRAQEAVERGYEAIRPGINSMQLGDLTAWMRRATPGEIQHMRIGVLNRLDDLLANANTETGRGNALRGVLRNEGQRRVLQRIFGGEAGLNDLLRRLDRQSQIFNARASTGLGTNSMTAQNLGAAESQRALTNPRTFRDWAANIVLREGGDRFDETVSNNILETAAINANQAAREMATVGGAQNWMGGRGLLSAALRERQRMLAHRPNALANTIGASAYAAVGVPAGAGYGGF